MRQHDRRSACDSIRAAYSGCVEAYLGPILGGVSQAPLAISNLVEHYPERCGRASGNIDAENVCPTVKPSR